MLVHTDDPHTKLKTGDLGTVTGQNEDFGQIEVRWDSGSSLSLLDGIDRYIILNDGDVFIDGLGKYITEGYRFLDTWNNIPQDSDFHKIIDDTEFPFKMSFDEYLCEMSNVYQELVKRNNNG